MIKMLIFILHGFENHVRFFLAFALGIEVTSFFEAREKDTTQSPTFFRERPKNKEF